ncbi:MAG: hypothetical protein FWG07_04920 [Treponema sp.]|nr:hypothetical protein [Treponema sp.]
MELIILEYFAAFFLFLSIIRPLIRGLWKLNGLTVCPLLALGIIVGIFPAYGFRPECIPLLLFAICLVIANMSDFLALFSSLHSDAYRDKGLLFTFGSAVAFAFTLWITLHFAPPMDTDLSTNGVKTIFLQGGKLHIRIYDSDAEYRNPQEGPELRPLLILLPPVAGSFTVTDEVCMALRDRGFTVLTCSRLKFDSPFFDRNGMPVRLGISGLHRLGNALSRGLHNVKANAGGRKLEEIRRLDTLYLLREINENRNLSSLMYNTDKNMIFLVGYGAGGAALTVLAGRDDFSVAFPQVCGIVTIEAPLLSSLEGDPLPDPLPIPTDPFSRLFPQVYEYIEKLKPRKITHITQIPRPGLPVLFLLSDRVIDEKSGRYETILRAFRSSRNAALIAAVPGAGPFDYSASPIYYPIFSSLFRGAEQTESDRNWPELTASLITNFAVLVLENSAVMTEESEDTDEIPVLAEPQRIPLVKTALDNNIYLEHGGVWQIPGVQTILQP